MVIMTCFYSEVDQVTISGPLLKDLDDIDNVLSPSIIVSVKYLLILPILIALISFFTVPSC